MCKTVDSVLSMLYDKTLSGGRLHTLMSDREPTKVQMTLKTNLANESYWGYTQECGRGVPYRSRVTYRFKDGCITKAHRSMGSSS